MRMMTGVVMALASWYVPMELFCRERLVKATKPQKLRANHTILPNWRLLGEKMSIFWQMKSPSQVTRKWTSVSVMLGKP